MPVPLMQVSLFQLFDGSNFKFDIPPYQRSYSWRTKQVYELLRDLHTAYTSKKEYFLVRCNAWQIRAAVSQAGAHGIASQPASRSARHNSVWQSDAAGLRYCSANAEAAASSSTPMMRDTTAHICPTSAQHPT